MDGYNIIYAWPELKRIAQYSLDGARDKLLSILSNYQGYKTCRVIVVFDAHLVKNGNEKVEKFDSIKVIYTKETETADAYIERSVKNLTREHKVRVATSDNLEQIMVSGKGAIRLSAHDLLIEVTAAENELRTNYTEKRPIKNNLLFDNLDKETAALLEKMRLNKG